MDEIKRMQQLAGLNEITVTNPGDSRPEWINKDSPRAKILVDVYYIEDDAYAFGGMRGTAVAEPELDRLPDADEGFLYIKEGENGWYDEDRQMFESENEQNTVRVREEYIEY
jgi:hypothetical protein